MKKFKVEVTFATGEVKVVKVNKLLYDGVTKERTDWYQVVKDEERFTKAFGPDWLQVKAVK